MIFVFAPMRRILKQAFVAVLAILLVVPWKNYRTTKRTCRCDGGDRSRKLGVLGGLGRRTAEVL